MRIVLFQTDHFNAASLFGRCFSLVRHLLDLLSLVIEDGICFFISEKKKIKDVENFPFKTLNPF